ncbi:hypothetical protein RFEPED_1045 [Rickettsia felis str. Pedreira]|uniref:Uncharacterized protein n=1 Tax=Rickettsia felis str. Pedreira TaxID=1359196 RepID=A0A0F3MVS2_RICFI|nr:hypothetical protein RFEPED_1045 [Rickettsia felis str. Pedreira]
MRLLRRHKCLLAITGIVPDNFYSMSFLAKSGNLVILNVTPWLAN